MSEFFNMDNKLFQGIGKIVDCIWLSVLYMVCAIPFAFTAYLAYQTASLIFWLVSCITAIPLGVATTALYYTTHKVLRCDRSYLWKEYKRAWKENFKQATICWLIFAGIGALLGFDIYVMYGIFRAGSPYGSAYVFFAVLLMAEILWMVYTFAYIARFQNSTKKQCDHDGHPHSKEPCTFSRVRSRCLFGMADTAAVFDHSGAVCMVCRGNLRECLCELYQGRGQGRRERRFFVKGNF